MNVEVRDMPTYDENVNFYREQSKISSPGKYEVLFRDLPKDIHELCGVVQGLLLHQFWIVEEKNYGVTVEVLKNIGRDLNAEINLRSVEEILDFMVHLDDRPLTTARDVEKRTIGNCRDYSVLLVSMLRHQGIPARVRSGVARYFFPTEIHLEDHFICEFWNQKEQRWQRTDAQIDEVQRKALNVSMDMADLPPNQFLDGGEAYLELQEGRVRPEKIGIFDYTGEKYVRYKVISDLACINSVEVLPWEGWGICGDIDQEKLSEEDGRLIEDIARMLVGMGIDNGLFTKAHQLFMTHPKLGIPTDYKPYYFELPAFK